MAQKKYLDETGLGVLVSETKNYVNAKRVILTQAQYDALPSTKLTDGVEYCITDAAVVPGNTASNISYSNTTSGLTATDVQAAVDEVVATKAGGAGLVFSVDSNGILNVTY